MTTATSPTEQFPRLRLAVSACLLGERVRYDGGHKKHAFLTDVLADHVDYLPVCPEAGIGLGVPRPPIHLVGDRQRPRALGVADTSLDVTAALAAYATTTLDRLHAVSGYIFKQSSPSCGLRRVKLYSAPGHRARRQGTGIFARLITNSLPLLPVAEENCLDDPRCRENFICRVYVYRRWQDLLVRGLDADSLLDFHTAHRDLILTHSQAAGRRLDKLLSELTDQQLAHTADTYVRDLMTTLARPSSRARHYGVLRRLAGRIEPRTDHRQWTALAARLNAYHDGNLPLSEVIVTLRRQFDRYPDNRGRVYLHPYPDSLELRRTL
jgi:uncharacterized protein YbbK (DUF523 family)/uncharacterized protein YbgA (DUF1722 family)